MRGTHTQTHVAYCKLRLRFYRVETIKPMSNYPCPSSRAPLPVGLGGEWSDDG